MPPKRSAAAKASNQPTLAFHGKSSKVTKPGARKSDGKSTGKSGNYFKPTKAAVESPASTDVEAPAKIKKEEDAELAPEDETSELTTAEKAIEDQATKVVEEVKKFQTAEEEEASKVSEAQINRYWRAKEAARKAPRVHQSDLSVHEKVLREWDMSGQYGVSVISFTSAKIPLFPKRIFSSWKIQAMCCCSLASKSALGQTTMKSLIGMVFQDVHRANSNWWGQ
jgi:DNA polymerase delta subunit 4